MKAEIIKDYSEIVDCMQPLLSLLNERQHITVLEATRVASYGKHESIYECGSSPDHLLCVLTGQVHIYCDGVGGRSQIMRILAPGQFFGYRAFLANEPYVTAACAFEATRLCTVPMPLIAQFMNESIPLCQFFVRELATDLGISDQRTVGLTQKHMRGRMAEAILYLEEHFGTEDDNHTLATRITRDELAQLSNMTTSNAIRTLSAFSTEGIVEVHGRRIIVCDHERLVHLNKMG